MQDQQVTRQPLEEYENNGSARNLVSIYLPVITLFLHQIVINFKFIAIIVVMLPLLLKKNTKSFDHSFEMRRVIVPHTYEIWHHHLELEFFHILTGKGTRYIGDSIEAFSDGDMVLVGSQLAHVWRSDEAYYLEGSTEKVELILTHFQEDFAGKDFLHLPEMKHVKEMLIRAKQGIQIVGKTRDIISERLKNCVTLPPDERLIELLKILSLLGKSKEVRLLSSIGFVASYKPNNSERIDKVYDYLFNHFASDLSLEQVANIANMNPSAFCRYFKSSTFKSFTQVLNDVRIGNACRLLQQQHHSVSDSGYLSGFNNISYFIKTFKKNKGVTPLEFQRKHTK